MEYVKQVFYPIYAFFKRNALQGLQQNILSPLLKAFGTSNIQVRLLDRAIDLNQLDFEVQTINHLFQQYNLPIVVQQASIASGTWSLPWKVYLKSIFLFFHISPLASQTQKIDTDSPSASIQENAESDKECTPSHNERYHAEDFARLIHLGMQTAFGNFDLHMHDICVCIFIPDNMEVSGEHENIESEQGALSHAKGKLLRLQINTISVQEMKKGCISGTFEGITVTLTHIEDSTLIDMWKPLDEVVLLSTKNVDCSSAGTFFCNIFGDEEVQTEKIYTESKTQKNNSNSKSYGVQNSLNLKTIQQDTHAKVEFVFNWPAFDIMFDSNSLIQFKSLVENFNFLFKKTNSAVKISTSDSDIYSKLHTQSELGILKPSVEFNQSESIKNIKKLFVNTDNSLISDELDTSKHKKQDVAQNVVDQDVCESISAISYISDESRVETSPASSFIKSIFKNFCNLNDYDSEWKNEQDTQKIEKDILIEVSQKNLEKNYNDECTTPKVPLKSECEAYDTNNISWSLSLSIPQIRIFLANSALPNVLELPCLKHEENAYAEFACCLCSDAKLMAIRATDSTFDKSCSNIRRTVCDELELSFSSFGISYGSQLLQSQTMFFFDENQHSSCSEASQTIILKNNDKNYSNLNQPNSLRLLSLNKPKVRRKTRSNSCSFEAVGTKYCLPTGDASKRYMNATHENPSISQNMCWDQDFNETLLGPLQKYTSIFTENTMQRSIPRRMLVRSQSCCSCVFPNFKSKCCDWNCRNNCLQPTSKIDSNSAEMELLLKHGSQGVGGELVNMQSLASRYNSALGRHCLSNTKIPTIQSTEERTCKTEFDYFLQNIYFNKDDPACEGSSKTGISVLSHSAANKHYPSGCFNNPVKPHSKNLKILLSLPVLSKKFPYWNISSKWNFHSFIPLIQLTYTDKFDIKNKMYYSAWSIPNLTNFSKNAPNVSRGSSDAYESFQSNETSTTNCTNSDLSRIKICISYRPFSNAETLYEMFADCEIYADIDMQPLFLNIDSLTLQKLYQSQTMSQLFNLWTLPSTYDSRLQNAVNVYISKIQLKSPAARLYLGLPSSNTKIDTTTYIEKRTIVHIEDTSAFVLDLSDLSFLFQLPQDSNCFLQTQPTDSLTEQLIAELKAHYCLRFFKYAWEDDRMNLIICDTIATTKPQYMPHERYFVKNEACVPRLKIKVAFPNNSFSFSDYTGSNFNNEKTPEDNAAHSNQANMKKSCEIDVTEAPNTVLNTNAKEIHFEEKLWAVINCDRGTFNSLASHNDGKQDVALTLQQHKQKKSSAAKKIKSLNKPHYSRHIDDSHASQAAHSIVIELPFSNFSINCARILEMLKHLIVFSNVLNNFCFNPRFLTKQKHSTALYPLIFFNLKIHNMCFSIFGINFFENESSDALQVFASNLNMNFRYKKFETTLVLGLSGVGIIFNQDPIMYSWHDVSFPFIDASIEQLPLGLISQTNFAFFERIFSDFALIESTPNCVTMVFLLSYPTQYFDNETRHVSANISLDKLNYICSTQSYDAFNWVNTFFEHFKYSLVSAEPSIMSDLAQIFPIFDSASNESLFLIDHMSFDIKEILISFLKPNIDFRTDSAKATCRSTDFLSRGWLSAFLIKNLLFSLKKMKELQSGQCDLNFKIDSVKLFHIDEAAKIFFDLTEYSQNLSIYMNVPLILTGETVENCLLHKGFAELINLNLVCINVACTIRKSDDNKEYKHQYSNIIDVMPCLEFLEQCYLNDQIYYLFEIQSITSYLFPDSIRSISRMVADIADLSTAFMKDCVNDGKCIPKCDLPKTPNAGECLNNVPHLNYQPSSDHLETEPQCQNLLKEIELNKFAVPQVVKTDISKVQNQKNRATFETPWLVHDYVTDSSENYRSVKTVSQKNKNSHAEASDLHEKLDFVYQDLCTQPSGSKDVPLGNYESKISNALLMKLEEKQKQNQKLVSEVLNLKTQTTASKKPISCKSLKNSKIRNCLNIQIASCSILVFKGSQFPDKNGLTWKEQLAEIQTQKLKIEVHTYHKSSDIAALVSRTLTQEFFVTVQELVVLDQVENSIYQYLLQYLTHDALNSRPIGSDIFTLSIKKYVSAWRLEQLKSDCFIRFENVAPDFPFEYSVEMAVLPLWLTLDQRTIDGFDEFKEQLKFAGVTEAVDLINVQPNFLSNFDDDDDDDDDDSSVSSTARSNDYSLLLGSINELSSCKEDNRPSGGFFESAYNIVDDIYSPEYETSTEENDKVSQEKLSSKFISNFLIRHCIIHAMLLKLDYNPRALNATGLRLGELKEVINFLASFCSVEGYEVYLSPQELENIASFEELIKFLSASWSRDFTRTHVLRWLTVIPSVKSVVNISCSMRNLINEIVHLCKDHLNHNKFSSTEVSRFSWKIIKSIAFFLRDCTVEGINLSEKILQGTHCILVNAEKRLTPQNCPRYPVTVFSGNQDTQNVTDIDSAIRRLTELNSASVDSVGDNLGQSTDLCSNQENIELHRSQDSWYLVDAGSSKIYEPEGISDGLFNALQCVKRGVSSASDAVSCVKIPSDLSLNAMQALSNLLPIFILRAALGFTEAISSTLMGVKNRMDPISHQNRKSKMRHGTCKEYTGVL